MAFGPELFVTVAVVVSFDFSIVLDVIGFELVAKPGPPRAPFRESLGTIDAVDACIPRACCFELVLL